MGGHYKPDLQQYVEYCNAHDMPVGIRSLQGFKDSLLEQGYKAATINKKLAGIRSSVSQVASRYLNVKEIQVLKLALREVKPMRLNRNANVVTREKVLTTEEIRKLIVAVSQRLGLMIRFLYLTGLRISEMCSVKLADVRESDKYVSVRVIGKGQKERIIKVSRAVVDDIKAFFGGKVYLFETQGGRAYRRQYVSNQIEKAGRRCLGKAISAHTLRHSFATAKIAKTGKIKAVSEYLGHSSTATTMDMYVHEELSLDDLEEEL